MFKMANNFDEIYVPSFPFSSLGHMVVVANLLEKHDRSTPSDYHWKILKCRMVIFSHSTIVACPDEREVKQIHIIFNKHSNDYNKLITILHKYTLKQEGKIREVTETMYKKCFQYTMLARIAPTWNVIGYDYLINNRDFLTTNGPQNGVNFQIHYQDGRIKIKLKAIKLTIIRPKHEIFSGELVRVFPSLNKAMVEEYTKALPEHSTFKCYKDLKRHWKNVHGYRLPEEESPYYSILFWRGDPMTYPQVCVTQHMPVIVPVPKKTSIEIINNFIEHLKNKMDNILGAPIQIIHNVFKEIHKSGDKIAMNETQSISLCTPTQKPI